jgi:hypothetical protein
VLPINVGVSGPKKGKQRKAGDANIGIGLVATPPALLGTLESIYIPPSISAL